MIKKRTDTTSANTTAEIIIKFHAALDPNLSLIHVSILPGSSSYSSGAYCSSISADSIRVDIPFTKERAKATIPLANGTFMTDGDGAFFFVLRYRPPGSLIASAILSGPCIIIPSITACPPIEVGQASLIKILL
jgi:hypothetical protein